MRHASAMMVDYAELSDESEDSEASDESEHLSDDESAEALSVSGDESDNEGGTLAVKRQAIVRQGHQRPTLQQRAAASMARLGEGRASLSHGKRCAGGSKLARGLHTQAQATSFTAISQRADSIAGHSKYRRTEQTVAELPRGAVNVADKPSRSDEKYAPGVDGDAAWTADMQDWERTNVAGRVRQQRADASYEHTVGRINDWLTQQGHPSFARWVADEESGLYELELILTEGVDGKPTPKLPTVEQVIDWIFSYSCGGAPKGGRKEYRAGPWYAQISGKTQAAQLMSGAAKAFGYGKHADKPPVLTTIEQHISKMRQWIGDKLRDFPLVANPMQNMRISEAIERLEGQIGRHRVAERLPRVVSEEEVEATYSTAHVTEETAGTLEKAIEETQNTLYLAKNALLHGERAHDGFWYNWGDWDTVSEGVQLSAVATKNNKKQVDRPKRALPCVTGCSKALKLNEQGFIEPGDFCISCLVEHLRALVCKLLRVEEVPPDLPIFCDFKQVVHLNAGSTLCIEEEQRQSVTVPLLVCCVTQAEEQAGYKYDRSEAFVVNGDEFWPPCRGTWFHVEGSAYAVRVWATADGVSSHLKLQLKRGAARSGTTIDVSRVSSKSCRRSMATLLSRKGVPLDEIRVIGEWSSEAMVRRYIEMVNVFALTKSNHADLMLRQGGANVSAIAPVASAAGSSVGGDGHPVAVLAAPVASAAGSSVGGDGHPVAVLSLAVAMNGDAVHQSEERSAAALNGSLQRAMAPVRRHAIQDRVGHQQKTHTAAYQLSLDKQRRRCCVRNSGQKNPLVMSELRQRPSVELLLQTMLWDDVESVKKALHDAGVCVSNQEIESYRQPKRRCIKQQAQAALAQVCDGEPPPPSLPASAPGSEVENASDGESGSEEVDNMQDDDDLFASDELVSSADEDVLAGGEDGAGDDDGSEGDGGGGNGGGDGRGGDGGGNGGGGESGGEAGGDGGGQDGGGDGDGGGGDGGGGEGGGDGGGGDGGVGGGSGGGGSSNPRCVVCMSDVVDGRRLCCCSAPIHVPCIMQWVEVSCYEDRGSSDEDTRPSPGRPRCPACMRTLKGTTRRRLVTSPAPPGYAPPSAPPSPTGDETEGKIQYWPK